jgi:hypothetical protein
MTYAELDVGLLPNLASCDAASSRKPQVSTRTPNKIRRNKMMIRVFINRIHGFPHPAEMSETCARSLESTAEIHESRQGKEFSSRRRKKQSGQNLPSNPCFQAMRDSHAKRVIFTP